MGKRGRGRGEAEADQPRPKRGRPSKPKPDIVETEQPEETTQADSKRAGRGVKSTRSKRAQDIKSIENIENREKDSVNAAAAKPDKGKDGSDEEGPGKTKGRRSAAARGRGRRKLPAKCQADEPLDEVDGLPAPSSTTPTQQMAQNTSKAKRRTKPSKEVDVMVHSGETASAQNQANPIIDVRKSTSNPCKVEMKEESSDSDDFEDVPDTKSITNHVKQVMASLPRAEKAAANDQASGISDVKVEEMSDSDGFEDVPDTSTQVTSTAFVSGASSNPNNMKNSLKEAAQPKRSKAGRPTKDGKKGSTTAKQTDSKTKPTKQAKRRSEGEAKGKGGSPKKKKLADANSQGGLVRQSSQIDMIDVAAMVRQMEGVPQGEPVPSTSGVKGGKRGRPGPVLGSDSEGSDWEEVEELEESNETQASKSSGPIVITVDAPEGFMMKRKKKQFDWKAHLQRQMNRYRKDVQISMHKVHVLCLLSLGMQQNAVCNDSDLQSIALSLVPVDLLKRMWDKVNTPALKALVTWFREAFPIEACDTKSALMTRSKLEKLFAAHKAHNTEQLAVMLVLVLRAVGVESRLLFSLQPVSIKSPASLDSSSKASNKKQPKKKQSKAEKESDDEDEDRPPKTDTKPGKKVATSKKSEKLQENEKKNVPVKKTSKSKHSDSRRKDGTADIPEHSQKKTSTDKVTKKGRQSSKSAPLESDSKAAKKPALRARKPAKSQKRKPAEEDESSDNLDSGDEYSPSSSGEEGSNYSEEEKKCVSGGRRSSKGKATLKAKPKSRPSVESSDDEFEDSQVSYRSPAAQRQKFKAKKNRKVLSDSSDVSLSESSKAKGCDIWVEVFLPHEDKWICVDCTGGELSKPHGIEDRATQPVHYVLAYGADGSVKDVTARYASQWMSSTRRLRAEPDWWEETLLPYKVKDSHSNRRDDLAIKEQLLNKPLPTSIGEYKNHPLYALSRHLLKFEAIYPDTAMPLGYIRHEPVYARECVHTLHSRENWLKEGRLVRIGETPYKYVKSRKKWSQRNDTSEPLECELFGHWQTEIYIPPPAHNGKVPKNEYGNVELFKPWMLPGGTVHVQVPGLQRVARKLNIDIAPAMVGWDHHCGWPHPVLEGWIVCEEHKDILLAAWEEDQENQRQREQEKREKRALGNWKLLVKGLLIKQRLKKKFDQKDDLIKLVQEAAEDSSDSEEEEEEVEVKSKGKAAAGKKGRKATKKTAAKKTAAKKEASSEDLATDVQQSWPNRKQAFK